jgi:hypothetical protein
MMASFMTPRYRHYKRIPQLLWWRFRDLGLSRRAARINDNRHPETGDEPYSFFD